MAQGLMQRGRESRRVGPGNHPLPKSSQEVMWGHEAAGLGAEDGNLRSLPYAFPPTPDNTAKSPWFSLGQEGTPALGQDGKSFSPTQGKFLKGDKAEDGFHGVSPVNAFPPQNNYGKMSHQVPVNTHKLFGGIFLSDRRGREKHHQGSIFSPGLMSRTGGCGTSSEGLTHLLCCRAL